MPISKNFKNSWRIANSYYEKLKDMSENPQLELFEASREALENNIEEYHYMSHRYDPQTSTLEVQSPLDRFLDDISEGIYPTPEVLFSIAECFHHYFNSEGKADLEDIFFGVTPEKGTGNYSAQRMRHKRFSKLALWESFEHCGSKKTNRKRRSLATLIEEDIVLHGLLVEGEDMDSFLRAYRRWKKATKHKTSNLNKEELELYYQRFLR
jgi:hypothetical protein